MRNNAHFCISPTKLLFQVLCVIIDVACNVHNCCVMWNENKHLVILKFVVIKKELNEELACHTLGFGFFKLSLNFHALWMHKKKKTKLGNKLPSKWLFVM